MILKMTVATSTRVTRKSLICYLGTWLTKLHGGNPCGRSKESVAFSKVEVPEIVRERVMNWNAIERGRVGEVFALLSDDDWRRAHEVDIALGQDEEEFEGQIKIDEGLAWEVTYSGVTVLFWKVNCAGDIFVVDVGIVIDRQHFERFCSNRSGQPFETRYRHIPFTIEVTGAFQDFQITFVSENGNRWTTEPGLIDRYLSCFGHSGGSLHPSDYQIRGPTIAPRMIALFSEYLDHLQ